MIREITCNKQQEQMIVLKLVGGPESYRRVGTAEYLGHPTGL